MISLTLERLKLVTGLLMQSDALALAAGAPEFLQLPAKSYNVCRKLALRGHLT